MKNAYSVLGIARSATVEDIKLAFRKIAVESHPDIFPGDRSKELRFKEASCAYHLLLDVDKRRELDRQMNASEEVTRGSAKRAASSDAIRDHVKPAVDFVYDRYGRNPVVASAKAFTDVFLGDRQPTVQDVEKVGEAFDAAFSLFESLIGGQRGGDGT